MFLLLLCRLRERKENAQLWLLVHLHYLRSPEPALILLLQQSRFPIV